MDTASVAELKEALYWKPLDDGQKVLCELCPFMCKLAEGRAGPCKVRKNVGGKLRALTYGRVSSMHLDPIEKKPLFHFYPGSWILSLGTVGCNLSCRLCQNWTISQEMAPTQDLGPRQAVELAKRPGNLGIAFTYNEPFIWYEYILDTAPLVRDAGMKTVMVTNGYASSGPWRRLLRYVDAMNIDVKAITPEFYRKICRAKLEPVLEAVKMAKEEGVFVEVTNLVVTNWNDSDEDLERITDWFASVDPDMPVHFSRYHPDYLMTEPATPLSTLRKAYEIARRKLRYVYLGNAPGIGGEDTTCPGCGAVAVQRLGYSIGKLGVKDGRCIACGYAMPFVGA
jgi:pyruvate formate lyase activating enzyme